MTFPPFSWPISHDLLPERRWFPVIHPVSAYAVARAVDLVRAEGADGVFLINQGVSLPALESIVALVYSNHGAFPIGVNALGETPEDALRYAEKVSATMLWTDNALLGDRAKYLERRARLAWPVQHFGGVAFKYQPQPANLISVLTAPLFETVDVVTTSGQATGEPPTTDKVRLFRSMIAGRRLAIASGVSEENLAAFAPFVTDFLVASSLERSFGVFDPGKVKAFGVAMRRWKDEHG